MTPWFIGKQRWLLNITSVANVAVLLPAVPWVATTLRLDAHTRPTFVTLVAIIATLLLPGGEAWLSRLHAGFRRLASGQEPPTQAHRVAALREFATFSRGVARATISMWVLGSLLLGGSFVALADGSIAVALRLVSLGTVIGLMSAVSSALAAEVRTRPAINALAQGVPVAEVLRALEGSSKTGLRWRVVAFTMIIVGLPSGMLVDIAFTSMTELHEARLAAGGALSEALVSEHLTRLLVRMGLLLAMSVGLAVVAARAGAELISHPLRSVADDAKAIASGRLEPHYRFGGVSEVGTVTSTFSYLKERLWHAVVQLRNAATVMGGASATLRTSSRSFEAGASEQAAALNQTSATTEELAHSARQIASNASAVQELAQRTLEATQTGHTAAEAFTQAVVRMRQDNQSIAAAVQRLQQRVQQIGRIVEVINGVADRSDLLALSAELEGSRAGDVGRGFALVAAEMRRLAENVLESTAEVEELISEIRLATQQTALATDRASRLTEGSTTLAASVGAALNQVAELAKNTSLAVRSITLATQQQQTGTDQLAEAMADILGVTQQGLSATRQLSQANEQLETLAKRLGSTVASFEV